MRGSITPEHQAALSELVVQRSVSAEQIRRLRARFGEVMSQRLLSAAALQGKARRKLGDGIWWVTERSLQQATAWQVARVKATWFGEECVYDLCCGIGGDALPLARRGPVVAVDADEEIAAMVEANLRAAANAVGPESAKNPQAPAGERNRASSSHRVICADAIAAGRTAGAVLLHIDPDRRAAGGRSSHPDRYQPSWSEVWRLAEQASGAAIKLAPAARLDDASSAAGHRCWISLGGTVREQTLLVGEVAARAALPPGQRSAVVCRADGRAARYLSKAPRDRPAPIAEAPQAVLVDPDAAIRAAGLTEAFALEHGLETLGGPSGFLTGAALPSAASRENAPPLAVSGRVMWHGASDDRKLRRQLRQLNVYPEVVKVRGTDHQPAEIARRLRGCGEQAVTLWLGRAGGKVFAAVTEKEVASSE